MLRFTTAGESHGKCLVGVLEGLPAGLSVDVNYINGQLRRRRLGYGRGARMKMEEDQIEIASGVRHGITLGSPIAFIIQNKDWANWRVPMSTEPISEALNIESVTRPRPGHADLPGVLKYQTQDVRNVLERASARETAARVACGAFCRLFLAHFGTRIASHVLAIGKARVAAEFEELESSKILDLDPESAVRCADKEAEQHMITCIDEATEAGDTLGGLVEVVASAVPPGLGSYIQWDRRLDGQIAQAMLSIHAAKAMEIGNGVAGSLRFGSDVHDEIFYDSQKQRFYRKTNRAGGIEGGVSNGEDIRVRVYFKPIPTLRKPLRSVDIRSKEPAEAVFERSDVCIVPAGGVVAEAMLGIVLARAFLEKFGGDSIKETERNYGGYVQLLRAY